MHLASALRHGMRRTRSLVIDGNDIGSDPEVLEAWCVAIAEHPGLQHVSLRDVGLDTIGAERIGRTLLWNTILFSVHLGHNRIGDSGVACLVDALENNKVLLELGLEGTDATRGLLRRLSMLLEQNAARYPGGKDVLKNLHGLRQVRAEAQTAMLMKNRIGVTVGLRTPLPRDENGPRERDVVPCLRGDGDVHDLRGEPPANLDCDDEGGRILAELLRRSEAGWRYGPAEQERMHDLRRQITELKAQRHHDHTRYEENLEAVAAKQADGRHREIPTEHCVFRLKERLAVEVEETKVVLREQVSRKVDLTKAMEELEEVERGLRIYQLGATKHESSLKQRYREVIDEVTLRQAEKLGLEESVEALTAANERLRGLLHAHRFYTDEERFVPGPKIVASVT